MRTKPIYLDYHATTPLDSGVLRAMMPFLTKDFGNASSINHLFGKKAADAVVKARTQVAQLLGAKPEEILFTSGGTEADNLAIQGIAHAYQHQGRHIITSVVEHKAVLDSCKQLEKTGFQISYLPVDRFGSVSPESVAQAITKKTILVSIMAANNEVGTIQDLASIGNITAEKSVLFHSDATQAIGKIPIDVNRLKLDLLSLSAHKMYGPKGVGALFVRKKNPRIRLEPLFFGGGQEQGLRSGTFNVPGIVGLGAACKIAARQMEKEYARIQRLRILLDRGIRSKLSHVVLNGHPDCRLPGNLSLSFEFVDGESLMRALPEIALSSGSACSTTHKEPSYVLKAIGLSDALAHSTIRFCVGRMTTKQEIDLVAKKVVSAVMRLRKLSPLYHDFVEGKSFPLMAD